MSKGMKAVVVLAISALGIAVTLWLLWLAQGA